jgi:hypothetical protein
MGGGGGCGGGGGGTPGTPSVLHPAAHAVLHEHAARQARQAMAMSAEMEQKKLMRQVRHSLRPPIFPAHSRYSADVANETQHPLLGPRHPPPPRYSADEREPFCFPLPHPPSPLSIQMLDEVGNVEASDQHN